MSSSLAALNSDTVKTIALGVSGGSVLIGLVLMKVISSIIGKIVSLIVFLAIALAGFSQRAAISDCAEKVKDQVTSGSPSNAAVATTCRIFGRNLTINVDLP